MEDVLGHGALPVPAALRSSGPARRGYRYPHDYVGDDVAQQYLPDKLADRHYYFPGDEGAEIKIRERLERLRDGRLVPPRRKGRIEGQPDGNPMAAGSEAMRRRRQNLTEIAAEQRHDAGDGTASTPDGAGSHE
jgi:hypothetical protein